MSEPTKEQIDEGALSRQRAEFEAWYSPKFAGGSVANMPFNPSSGEYRQGQHEIAWRAWESASINKPTWKSAPDVAGLWIYNTGFCKPETVRLTRKMLPLYLTGSSEWRYYGPIPEDENES